MRHNGNHVIADASVGSTGFCRSLVAVKMSNR